MAAVGVEARVVHNRKPAQELLAAADLIVVGNNRAAARVGRVLGSVGRQVTRLAHLPVIVVHEHDPEHGSRTGQRARVADG